MPVDFYMKSTCATCRKAKAYLERKGVPLRLIDIISSPPPEEVLTMIIDRHGVKGSMNPRSTIYKEEGFGKDPPSKGEAIKLMLKDPNLIKRPVIKKGDRVLIGFEEGAMADLLK